MAAERFIARSRVMRALTKQIRRFASTDSSMLIAGKTGTRKNAVARGLHLRSGHAQRPFVTIDCASLSRTPIDSGMVCLDGVTELPLEAQGKRLRIVEEKRVELRDYAWPGNVHERRQVVEIPCQTARDTVMLTDLQDEVLVVTFVPAETTRERPLTLDEMERRYVAATLRAVGGKQTEAAARLGINRKALWEKRKRYGMD